VNNIALIFCSFPKRVKGYIAKLCNLLRNTGNGQKSKQDVTVIFAQSLRLQFKQPEK